MWTAGKVEKLIRRREKRSYLCVLKVIEVNVTDVLGGGKENVAMEGVTVVLWVVKKGLFLFVGQKVVLGFGYEADNVFLLLY